MKTSRDLALQKAETSTLYRQLRLTMKENGGLSITALILPLTKPATIIIQKVY